MFAQGWFGPEFHAAAASPSIDMLGGPYLLLKDLIEVFVLVSIGYALTRWLVTHPPRLYGFRPAEDEARGQDPRRGDRHPLLHRRHHADRPLLRGGSWRCTVTARTPRRRSPGSRSGRRSRRCSRRAPARAGRLRARSPTIGWWGHNLAVLFMLNLLPLSKHFHIITGLPNTFFRKLEPLGALSKMDLENGTTFGTSHIDQFTWKQVLDMYTCTECGRCSSNCPATLTGKPLAPRQLLLEPPRLPLRDPGRADREARRCAEAGRGRGAARGRQERRRRRERHPRRGAVELQRLPRLRGGVPGHDRVRRQDRRHAPPPGPGGGALPDRADPRLQGHGERSRIRGASAPRSATPGPRASRSRSSAWPTSPTPSTSTTSAAAAPSTTATRRRRISFAKILKKAGIDFAHLRQGGALQRRLRAPPRQRVPLPEHGADAGRADERRQA